MSLRILGDDPGYALLEFDQSLDAPALMISVRSKRSHPEEHLGPQGSWQKKPHYFAAVREPGPALPARYRIGPEIVNHMLYADSCEIATADRSLAEEAEWIDPIPQPLKTSGSGSIYAEKPVKAAVVSAEILNKTSQETASSPDVIEPEVLPEPDQPHLKSRIVIGATVALAALLGIIFATNLHCALFGIGCVTVNSDFDNASACGRSKRPAEPCAVKACFAEYLAGRAPAAIAPEAHGLMDEAEIACRSANGETEAANTVETCGASARADGKTCGVRETCVVPYLSKYPFGPHAEKINGLGDQADRDCTEETKERDAAAKARDCAAKKNAAKEYCLIEAGCLTGYRSEHPAGKSLAGLDAVGTKAHADCQAQQDKQRADDQLAVKKKQEDLARKLAAEKAETRAFADAGQCVRANACVAEACFAEYQRVYGRTGAHAADADKDLAKARSDCDKQPGNNQQDGAQQVVPNGNYSARASSGCGAGPQFGIQVAIRDGRISWSHSVSPGGGAAPFLFPWSGTIGPDGRISASADGLSSSSATGQFNDSGREIELHYPSCPGEVIKLTISSTRTSK